VELTLALGLLALLCVALAGLVQTSLEAQAVGDDKSDLYSEGIAAMGRMATSVRRATIVHFPNAHTPSRTTLAVSGALDDDVDSYFGDTTFPRIDEDLGDDMTLDGYAGIQGYDDDGDGLVDELPADPLRAPDDDDEDGLWNEDPWDGRDNDGDGNIDEDVPFDMNEDGEAGLANVDDDGDGQIDEQIVTSTTSDDDEDGQFTEDRLNPVVFELDAGRGVLREVVPQTAAGGDLCTHVTAFTATYVLPSSTRGPIISLSLTLTSDADESITFTELVYPRNVLQRTGKRIQ
jgi:hypothetical protein